MKDSQIISLAMIPAAALGLTLSAVGAFAGSSEPTEPSPELSALVQEYEDLVGTGDDGPDSSSARRYEDARESMADLSRELAERQREARQEARQEAREAEREKTRQCVEQAQDRWNHGDMARCGGQPIWVCDPDDEDRDQTAYIDDEPIEIICDDGNLIGVVTYWTEDDDQRYLRRIRQAGYWVGVAAPRATADIVRSVTPPTPSYSGGSSSSGGGNTCYRGRIPYPC